MKAINVTLTLAELELLHTLVAKEAPQYPVTSPDLIYLVDLEGRLASIIEVFDEDT